MLSTSGPPPALGGELMTVSDPSELNRLMALASGGGQASAAWDGCLDRLHQVQGARAALARSDASSPRRAEGPGRRPGGGDKR